MEGIQEVVPYVVAAGTSLGLRRSSIVRTRYGFGTAAGPKRAMVMDEFEAWTREQFEELLGHCLATREDMETFTLPPEFFPGE